MNDFLINYGKQIISIILFGICAYTDYHEGKIKNEVVGAGVTFGIAINSFLYGTEGLVSSLVSLAFSCLFIGFYAMKQMGAGDVKMLMMLSSIMNIYYCVGATIMGSLFGAIYAIVQFIRTKDKHLKVPFAVFMFFGITVYQCLIWLI